MDLHAHPLILHPIHYFNLLTLPAKQGGGI